MLALLAQMDHHLAQFFRVTHGPRQPELPATAGFRGITRSGPGMVANVVTQAASWLRLPHVSANRTLTSDRRLHC
jgi:hypothetical protein